jgi:hypothetical protein
LRWSLDEELLFLHWLQLRYTIPPMPRAANHVDVLLAELEAAKNDFRSGHAAEVGKLLDKISKVNFSDPSQLIRFHECLLFLRAFPHAASHIALVERLLNSFHKRVDKIRCQNPDMSLFDEFDTSGIAGTTMQDALPFEAARWLAQRIPRNVDIAWDEYWDDYESERARGNTWPRFIPLLEEDGDVEANIPWRRWLDAARGRKPALSWLLQRFSTLPLAPQQQAELYDSLRIPIRWRLEDLKLSRTRNWSRPRRFYFHDVPLIQRNQVSLREELARPAPRLEKLSLAAGESVIESIREVMVVRYRELYGTTLGDPHWVVRADLGRGVVMHFWGLPRARRLPLRAYLAGYTLKNGVPINYVEAIGLCEWIEVGFNTFYTYRQGETAWIYAQALRCICALTGATTISIYPYQIGENNDEAIDSGAFWFYRKLGFRSGRADLQKLCENEERKIAADRRYSNKYRTPRRVLKRLAEAHMFFETRPSVAQGAWDAFTIRNLGLRINRRMAKQFDGDCNGVRTASLSSVAAALDISPSSLPAVKRDSLQSWSLVLALIPSLAQWTSAEKEKLIDIIRSKSDRNEMRFLRQTQLHPRLRAELLRLGTEPSR